MAQGARLSNIFALLRIHNMHYLDEWVKECVDHYVSCNPTVSDDSLWEQVKEQWLLSDLRDASISCLPPNLKDKPKVTLPGKYVLQVETMVDSGKARYTQYQELIKQSMDNVRATTRDNDDPPDKRCITMKVTDGVQDVHAMEYEVIPELRLNCPDQLPGFKIMITGPVMCRHGMLMLSRRNVTILGGEVSSLVQSNCYENLLIGVLGMTGERLITLPIQSNVQTSGDRTAEPVFRDPLRHSVAPERLDAFMDDEDDDFLLSLALESTNETPRGQLASNYAPDKDTKQAPLFGAEDIFSDDFTVPDHSSTEDKNSLKRRTTIESDSALIASTNDVKRPCTLSDNNNPFRDSSWSLPSVPNTPHSPPTATGTSNGSTDAHLRKNFNQISDTKKLRHSTKTKSMMQPLDKYLVPQGMKVIQEPKSINAKPYVYLHQICSKTLIFDAMYKVKAQILTLKTKIGINNDNFTLLAKISDGSYSIEVNFSSDILEDMLGFSPSEMVVMIKEKKKNTALAERLAAGFSATQQRLISLDCIFCIQFFKDSSTPRVVGLDEITMNHVKELQQRQI